MDRAAATMEQLQLYWRIRCLLPYGLYALLSFPLEILGISQFGWSAWLLVACFGVLILALGLDKNWRLSTHELCQKLDQQFPELQDSSQLLHTPRHHLSALKQLQQSRITQVLQQLQTAKKLQNLFPPWHRGLVLATTIVCSGLLLFTLLHWVFTGSTDGMIKRSVNNQQLAKISIVEATTLITPPSYTCLVAQTQALQVDALAGSTMKWNVQLNKPADKLEMLAGKKNYSFSAVDTVPSKNWQLTRIANKEDFYQLTANQKDQTTLLPGMHTIRIKQDTTPEFIFNKAPDQITVVPEIQAESSTLTPIEVEVSDDFAVVATKLLITLTSGDGENLRFRDEQISLEPMSVKNGKKYYRFNIPIERYKIAPGDELYWQLQAVDNRQPTPNLAKSRRFILRWPQDQIFGISESEGMAIKILPEYFRSQRQLIIDTEALLEEQQQLKEPEFIQRSEALAKEQNLLRMRYGRFLGEEDSALKHNDSEQHSEDKHEFDTAGHETQFGHAGGVIAAAGHQHDHTDHATIFDPETKELLRKALNAMWDAWRDLAIIEPEDSLPHQQRALRFIKEVQQASRIYLQRVGFEPPSIDESRRLSGERTTVEPPYQHSEHKPSKEQKLRRILNNLRNSDRLAKATMDEIYQLTQDEQKPQQTIKLSKLLRLYQQQPECEDCQQQLTQFLYTLLPKPHANPALPYERNDRGSFSHWLQNRHTRGESN
ncbi:MAG: hypothetical protein K0U59_00335 [Gammaproteobacteria bacterium]|nr:hypothetical protein [Gammaproteobacteria bacterium]